MVRKFHIFFKNYSRRTFKNMFRNVFIKINSTANVLAASYEAVKVLMSKPTSKPQSMVRFVGDHIEEWGRGEKTMKVE